MINFNEDKDVKAYDYIIENALAHSEVFNIPLDLHWHVFHGYMRRLSDDIAVISTDYLHASHYIFIHSPIFYDSIDGVALEEGQYRSHMSTFHFNGNLIDHECTVYSSEHKPLKKYRMKSPTCLDIYDEQELEEIHFQA